MFVQDNLQKLALFSQSDFSNSKFLIMFIGVVISPLILIATSGLALNNVWRSDFAWLLMAIGLLVVISSGLGLMMFRSDSYEQTPPTISQNLS